jgi:hypothetical protein
LTCSMPRLRQIPRWKSYIRVEVAIMEFFGKPQDYFNRVKTADENLVPLKSP